MDIEYLPNYDFTRLEDFQKAIGLDENQKEEMNLIIKDMVSHFFENVMTAVEIALKQKDDKCPHCKMSKTLANPSGYCNHVYYPNNCNVCKLMVEQTNTVSTS